jgi:hypothetical protein
MACRILAIAAQTDTPIGVLRIECSQFHVSDVGWTVRKAFQGLYHFGHVIVAQIDFHDSRKASVRTCDLTFNHVLIEPNDFDLNAEVVVSAEQAGIVTS